MNYERIYNEFIADRRDKEKTLIGYTEKHHILPRSLGGDNAKENLIKLTAQDHYFAHELLARIHGNGMWSALFLMSNSSTCSAKGAKINRINFEKTRIEYSKFQSKRNIGCGNPFYGKTHNKETVKKIIESRIQVIGEDHHEYNHEKVYWQNLETGERIFATQNVFRKIHGFNHKPVSSVFNGKKKSYMGWFCEKHNTKDSALDWGCKGIKHYRSDLNIYVFKHENGITFEGTRQDFYRSEHGVNEPNVRSLVTGRYKTSKGWTLIGIRK